MVCGARGSAKSQTAMPCPLPRPRAGLRHTELGHGQALPWRISRFISRAESGVVAPTTHGLLKTPNQTHLAIVACAPKGKWCWLNGRWRKCPGAAGSCSSPAHPLIQPPAAWFFLHRPLLPVLVSHILTWTPNSALWGKTSSHSMDLSLTQGEGRMT